MTDTLKDHSVKTSVSWPEALAAIQRMASSGVTEDFCQRDIDVLTGCAEKIRRLLTSQQIKELMSRVVPDEDGAL